jgi:hypothetical protein
VKGGAESYPVGFKDNEVAGKLSDERRLFEESFKQADNGSRHGVVGHPHDEKALIRFRWIMPDVGKIQVAGEESRSGAAGVGSDKGVGRMAQTDMRACSLVWPRPASSASEERGMLASTRKRMTYAGSK